MAGESKLRDGSLTDADVAIIRGLRARFPKIKNQKILGDLNIVRRMEGRADTNGGRISQVKNGHKKYEGIAAASSAEVDRFLEKIESASIEHQGGHMPLSDFVIKQKIPVSIHDSNKLNITETDEIECKESFSGGWGAYIRTIAAFANNKGGYLIFGVRDKTWEIIGLSSAAFDSIDRKDINQILMSHLSSGINFDTEKLTISGKSIGVIYVHKATMRPVIVTKNNSSSRISEGQIFYRYQGENRLIGAMELQGIIEDRVKFLAETILSKHVGNIIRNGIENSAVINLDTGLVDGKSGSFVIDESIIPKIGFIKEGEFVEKSGCPTLRLVGDVTPASSILVRQIEDIHKLYPLSWRDLVRSVKEKIQGAKDGDINQIIKDNNLKSNPEYSAFVFRSKRHDDEYKNSGKVATGTPSIYNESAISFITGKLAERLANGRQIEPQRA